MIPSTKIIGQQIEILASEHLKRHGLKLIERNYQCSLGEIDLIMRDKDTLVFIEVRHRKNTAYGDGIQSITVTKQRKLIRTAVAYLQRNNLTDKVACRFDVVATSKSHAQLVWIKNAFQVQ